MPPECPRLAWPGAPAGTRPRLPQEREQCSMAGGTGLPPPPWRVWVLNLPEPGWAPAAEGCMSFRMNGAPSERQALGGNPGGNGVSITASLCGIIAGRHGPQADESLGGSALTSWGCYEPRPRGRLPRPAPLWRQVCNVIRNTGFVPSNTCWPQLPPEPNRIPPVCAHVCSWARIKARVHLIQASVRPWMQSAPQTFVVTNS